MVRLIHIKELSARQGHSDRMMQSTKITSLFAGCIALLMLSAYGPPPS